MNTESDQTPAKSTNSALLARGTGFGSQQVVQFKITHKDLLLVAGILVALIIVFTTWLWRVQSQAESMQLFPTPKVSQTVLRIINQAIISKF